MGTEPRDTAANDPTDIARCTECSKVTTVISSSRGEPYPTGTDGTCPDCGNDEFSIIGG